MLLNWVKLKCSNIERPTKMIAQVKCTIFEMSLQKFSKPTNISQNLLPIKYNSALYCQLNVSF